MKKGKLLYFEGGEGCGKSSHLELMKKYLLSKEIPFEITREPGGEPLAEKVRKILLDKENGDIDYWSEILLFQASRSLLHNNFIIPKLEEGISIGQGRSGDSSIAYQGYGRGGDIDLIKKLNNLSTFGYKPDLAFMIDIDPEIGLAKESNPDRMSLEGLEFHKRVNKGYLEIAKENPNNYVVIPWIENGIEEMQKEMKYHINKLFKL